MLTIRDYTLGELRGNLPEIITAESVEMDALTKGDDDPFFVTLPIAAVGKTSGNGLHYDEALVAAIQAQMVGMGGLMGHIQDGERDTAFPIETADWIGTLRQGKTLWGKAYIPPGEAREYIRRLRARGGKLATSIYGPYATQEKQSDGSWKADGFTLESLDLAPASRAALKLGGDFEITSQMGNTEEDGKMSKTKDEILAELTLADVSKTLREQIVAEYKVDADTEKQIAELTAERDAEKNRVKELEEQAAVQQAAQFDAALDKQIAELVDWKVDGDDAEKRVAMVRSSLKSRILAEMGDERDENKIAETAKSAWEGDEMQLLAKTVKETLGGPRAIIGGKRRDAGKLEDTPEARREARRVVGI